MQPLSALGKKSLRIWYKPSLWKLFLHKYMGFCQKIFWLCISKLRVTRHMKLYLLIFPVRNYFISSAIQILATTKNGCMDPSRNVHFCSTLNILLVCYHYCKVFTINSIHSLFETLQSFPENTWNLIYWSYLFKQDLHSLQVVDEYWSWYNFTSDLGFWNHVFSVSKN